MNAVKLTDTNGYTRRGSAGETLWQIGETVVPRGDGNSPCGPGVLHMYRSELYAALFNQIHAGYTPYRLFGVETRAITGDDGLKLWSVSAVTVVEELPLPEITPEQRIAFAICIAPHPSTRGWAIRWLDGTDRTVAAAMAAESSAMAAGAAAMAAEWAARAAEWAARAAIAAGAAAMAAESSAREAMAAEWAAKGRLPFHLRIDEAWAAAGAILSGAMAAEEFDK